MRRPANAGEVLERLMAATVAKDLVAIVNIHNEQVENSQGHDRAYWLRQRAFSRLNYGTPANIPAAFADLDEAFEIDGDDLAHHLFVKSFAIRLQRPELLKLPPCAIRARIRRESYDNWRYWADIGGLQRLRRRWPQSYRGYKRCLQTYLNTSPEDLKQMRGWLIVIYSWCARAAIRVGRLDDADLLSARMMEVFAEEERPHFHPTILTITRGELAFSRGQFQAAKMEMQSGMEKARRENHLIPSLVEIDHNLLAARIAREEGNMVAFEYFCGQALEICQKSSLPLSEAEVRAVWGGAIW